MTISKTVKLFSPNAQFEKDLPKSLRHTPCVYLRSACAVHHDRLEDGILVSSEGSLVQGRLFEVEPRVFHEGYISWMGPGYCDQLPGLDEKMEGCERRLIKVFSKEGGEEYAFAYVGRRPKEPGSHSAKGAWLLTAMDQARFFYYY